MLIWFICIPRQTGCSNGFQHIYQRITTPGRFYFTFKCKDHPVVLSFGPLRLYTSIIMDYMFELNFFSQLNYTHAEDIGSRNVQKKHLRCQLRLCKRSRLIGLLVLLALSFRMWNDDIDQTWFLLDTLLLGDQIILVDLTAFCLQFMDSYFVSVMDGSSSCLLQIQVQATSPSYRTDR